MFDLTQFFRDSVPMLMRIGIGAGGVALIIMGIVIIIASNAQVQSAVGKVATAAATKHPVGAAVVAGSEVAS